MAFFEISNPSQETFFANAAAGNAFFIMMSAPNASGPQLAQRIFDTNLGVYVTYTSSITTQPDAGATTPPHSGLGNLNISTHEIL